MMNAEERKHWHQKKSRILVGGQNLRSLQGVKEEGQLI
jgi:hypothetical protein